MLTFKKCLISNTILLLCFFVPVFSQDSDITDGAGGNITARGENAPNETAAKAFDNYTSTKWLDFSPSESWIQYRFTNNNKYVLSKYSITSANDWQERDPADWQLLGSNDGTNWSTLDTRTDETFSSRFLRREFTVSNFNEFSFFRLHITSVKNPSTASSVQLAEIELIGHVYENNPPTVETAASVNPDPVYGTNCNLSVLGADDGGEANLTYTWATTGTPPGPVTFSANGTNSSKNSTATFSVSGDYAFEVTILDIPGLSVTSSVSVSVYIETPNCVVWDENTHYSMGDMVTYNGHGYQCIVYDVWSWPPTDTRYWSPTEACGAAQANPSALDAPDGDPVNVVTVEDDGTVRIKHPDNDGVTFTGEYGYINKIQAKQDLSSQLWLEGNASVDIISGTDASLTVGNGRVLTTADLEVQGKIKINNWTIEAPDFVFEKSFQIPSIEEMENHVTTKKHLPDMPSAADMKKNGVDIAEINMGLLKHVEILTLYIIEQNKKIKTLEKKIK